MPTPDETKRKAAAAYNAAADLFDRNAFWAIFGRRTVERLDLRPGERVLDVCCGSGASALPAAERVGQAGSVLAVDLAAALLSLGRAKAAARGLGNIEFRLGDMLELGLPDASFDAVICTFGIFFVPDMPAAVRELWRMVRPGGRLALTTWGPRHFEPAISVFWQSVREIRPELHREFNPWDRLTSPHELRALFAEGGAHDAEIVAEPGTHAIPSPDDWWTLLLGSGYRATIDQLASHQRDTVYHANTRAVGDREIRSVEANVVYGVARKS